MQGSHGDIHVVNKAFAGADSVFWLVPPDLHAERRRCCLCGLHAAGWYCGGRSILNRSIRPECQLEAAHARCRSFRRSQPSKEAE